MGVMVIPVAAYHGSLIARRTYGVRKTVNTQAWKVLLMVILGLCFSIPVLIGVYVETKLKNRFMIMIFAHGIPHYIAYYYAAAYFEQI